MPDLLSIPLTEGLTESQATELAMPEMARRLLPDVLIGLTLAGLFSATMSTADSQILVCSGAITQDINPNWKNSYVASKPRNTRGDRAGIVRCTIRWARRFLARSDCMVRTWCRTSAHRSFFACSASRFRL